MLPSRKSIGGTSAMSAAVHTANTPGSARAAAVSIDTMRPWACAERTMRMCNLMRKIDVAGKGAAPGDQRRILQPRHRLADPGSSASRVHAAARSSARRVTASTRSRRNSAVVTISSMGSIAAVAAAAAARNAVSSGSCAIERALGFGDASRIGLGAADREPRLDHLAALDAIDAQRCGKRKIPGAPVELVEAAARIGGEKRQPRFDQKLVVAQRRGHDALEEIARRDDALAARAFRHHFAVERRQHQAPFGRRIGMRQTAAERAAVADRVMRDVPHHVGEQFAERAVANRAVESRMTHAGADGELAARNGDAVERFDPVDVDEVRRLGEPERHRRHETLAAGKDAAIVAGHLRQQGDRLVDGLRRVIAEGRRFHRAGFISWCQDWD